MNFTVLTLVERYPVTRHWLCWWKIERWKGGQSDLDVVDGKRNVHLKETRKRRIRKGFFRMRFMPQFGRFRRTPSLLSSFGFSVWTGMEGCVWRSLNVFTLMVWREKPSLSVADKHVLPAACSQRLKIHLVHCVFFTLKVHWVASESWVLNRCPVNKVKSLQVVV